MNHAERFIQIRCLTKRETRVAGFLRHIKTLGDAGFGIQCDNLLARAHDFPSNAPAQVEGVENNIAAERSGPGVFLGGAK